MDHIRFSLLIDLGIFSLFYMILNPDMIKSVTERILYILLLCWLVVFLFILQAITGIVIFLAVGFILFWVYLNKVPYGGFKKNAGYIYDPRDTDGPGHPHQVPGPVL